MAIASARFFHLQGCVPMPSTEEQLCATEYVATKSPSVAARLVTANLRLVVKIAKDCHRTPHEISDLIQEGNLGLLHAVKRYDPSRGVKLSSYAAWWIRAYILKFTISNWQLVRAGTTQAQRKLFFSLRKERARLERFGAQADAKQLAKALDVKEKDVVTMLERFAGGETSMDAPRSTRQLGTTTIGDTLKASAATRPDVRVEVSDFAHRLQGKTQAFADTLLDRESEIFHRRLLSEEPDTLAHLAIGFGVTRERVRQLEERLKQRLRFYLIKELGDSLPATARRSPPRQVLAFAVAGKVKGHRATAPIVDQHDLRAAAAR